MDNDLISSQLNLNKKVNIIHDDIFKWEPTQNIKYDVIYFDIWEYINLDIYNEEMYPLKVKFKKYLKETNKSFISCWSEYEASHNTQLY